MTVKTPKFQDVMPEVIKILQHPSTSVAPEEIARIGNAKMEQIHQEAPWTDMEPLDKRINGILTMNASIKVKSKRFIQLMDETAAAIAPHTPCKSGCDQCCHIPAAILASEADIISTAIGRPRAQLKFRYPSQVGAETSLFYGTPCPFLKDHACSIYDIRPMVCRGHHSLYDTPELCDTSIPPEENFVPRHSVTAHIEVARASMAIVEVTGDIREFFPTE